jgi:hypothetical protein
MKAPSPIAPAKAVVFHSSAVLASCFGAAGDQDQIISNRSEACQARIRLRL